jgi:predicted N-acetyltransferase YhbS
MTMPLWQTISTTGSAETHVRQMTGEDIAAGIELVRAAGWNQTEADWRRFLHANGKGCFVAESEGKVCGTVATIMYGRQLAWIGMVLVSPHWRGRGIGTELVRLALQHLDTQGALIVKLDATPQGAAVYERLGFEPEHEIERWVLTRPSSPKPLHSRQTHEHENAQQMEEILETDFEVFGADRGALLRSLDRDAHELTAAISTRGRTRSYTLGRHGLHADQLGPWIADDPDTASELLTGFLSHSSRECLITDCFKSHPTVPLLLRSAGFQFSRPLTRMVRGGNRRGGRTEAICAILGPEFG